VNSGFTVYNQSILNDAESEAFNRRSHLYGDGLFETFRVHKGKICFWESHYFRLMSSMRILRLEIPLNWSPDDLETEILRFKPDPLIDYRVRLSVWREGSMGYTPSSNKIDWSINFIALDHIGYSTPVKKQKLALFQEHKKSKGLLSNLKLSESILYILAAKFASEQGVDDAIILSHDNHVLETSRGNVFLLKGDELMTPLLEDGALRGVMREQILKHAPVAKLITKEEKINPFDLLKADEIWITNAITGIVSVSNYRKSTYGCLKGNEMQIILNSKF
tara:strand:- start:2877 stop:3710 length:834 start_codon:yes stop_codon:yes gene_type:complete